MYTSNEQENTMNKGVSKALLVKLIKEDLNHMSRRLDLIGNSKLNTPELLELLELTDTIYEQLFSKYDQQNIH